MALTTRREANLELDWSCKVLFGQVVVKSDRLHKAVKTTDSRERQGKPGYAAEGAVGQEADRDGCCWSI